MGTNRFEAFSDGVFAIAITLLVLEIKVPEPGGETSLGHELLAQWPSYAAYVISFLSIGIIWINHHAMVRRLAKVDHSILVWNLLLLMAVSALPFTTALMADYLKESSGETLAAAVYAGSFLVMGAIFAGMNGHILIRREQLLGERLDLETRRRAFRNASGGVIPYVVALALAFVSPYLTLGVCAAIAVYYATPIASGDGFRAEAGS